MTKDIAVIPARGASKRIPQKNLLEIHGLPMIAWTIRAALSSQIFEQVLVSTEDNRIASVARRYGAEVPFLRTENYDDFSEVSAATISSLRQAIDFYDSQFVNVVQLMPNCPLRGKEEIIAAVKHFKGHEHNFQISALEFGFNNPWWAATLTSSGKPEPLFPEALSKRSQDLEKLYCPTGAIWIADIENLLRENTFYGPGHVYFPMSWEKAIDIDSYSDLEIAKKLMNSH